MFWAAERKGGKIVPADSAKPWVDYRCPTCQAPVNLRSGQYYADHFAHKPGQGKPDCEDFHYNPDLARASPIFAPPQAQKHVEPLQLSIQLDPELPSRSPRQWRLCLTVPKAPDAHGRISIKLGDQDIRPISLSKLFVSSETYIADPDTTEYGASWVSPEVRREYRDAVQHRIPGLDAEKASAFAATRSKYKPRTYALYWGRSYYLVWRSTGALTLPERLTSRPLARLKTWNCAVVALPHEPDTEIETWVKTYCDLTIARAERDWALLYPAARALGIEGELQIPASRHVLLALKSTGAEAPGTLTFSAGQTPLELELSGTRRHLVAVTNDQVTPDSIYLSWDDAYVATFRTQAMPPAVAGTVVRVVSDGPQGKHTADLHDTKGRELLASIRSRHLSLVGVLGHPLLSGHLRWREQRAGAWSELALPFSAASGTIGLGKLSDDLLQQLTSIVTSDAFDLVLDFGPFGTFEAIAKPSATPRRSLNQRLPVDLRARVEWLSRACHSFTDGQSRPLAVLDDDSLVVHFRSNACKPDSAPQGYRCRLKDAAPRGWP